MSLPPLPLDGETPWGDKLRTAWDALVARVDGKASGAHVHLNYATTSALNSHLNAADPHTQYLLKADAPEGVDLSGYAKIADLPDVTGMVRSVNTIAPDSQGNVSIDVGSGGGGTPLAGWAQTSSAPTAGEIQGLLNAADAAGGGVVRLPVGVFTMDSTLSIPYGCRLEGAGWTAWKDGAIDNPPRGTILKFPTGIGVAVRIGERATISNLRIQSAAGRLASGVVPSYQDVGLKVEGNSARADNVSVYYFSRANLLIDSEDAGSGNTSVLKVNHFNGYNVDCSYGQGHGVSIVGSDSNRCFFSGLNAVANRGHQLHMERTSRNWIAGHLDAAGSTAQPSVGMVSGIGNFFDCYIEASGSPVGGDHFHIGSEATHGIIMNPFYGRAKITYDSSATIASWNILESGGQRRLLQVYPAGGRTNNDTGQLNGSFVIDVGVPDGVSMTRMRQMAPGGTAVDVANINSTGSRWEWSIPFRLMNCTTAARPSGMADGAMVWDSTLGKPIFRKGSGWVDATGASV